MTTTTDNLAEALRALLTRAEADRIESVFVDDARTALAAYEAERTAHPTPAGEHTPGPWRVSVQRIPHGAANVLSRGYVVAHCDGPGGIGQADARRIVACVNACAGIPTADLEGARMVPADDETPLYELVRE